MTAAHIPALQETARQQALPFEARAHDSIEPNHGHARREARDEADRVTARVIGALVRLAEQRLDSGTQRDLPGKPEKA